jgi:hypothetical protein
VIKYRTGNCFRGVEGCEFLLCSVYISTNCQFTLFVDYLDELQSDFQKTKTNKKGNVISGDFNAENTLWGGMVTALRGTVMLEWAYSMELTVITMAKNPRGFADLTLVSEKVAERNPT